jgi:hypothetical protein
MQGVNEPPLDESDVRLPIYEGALIQVLDNGSSAWLEGKMDKADGTPTVGMVFREVVVPLHDELIRLQKQALQSTYAHRVAIYPFGPQACADGKIVWPWANIRDRQPLEMNNGDVLEVLDSQLAPWLHCRIFGAAPDAAAAKGYTPNTYSLDMLDYVEMMKAWEVEQIGKWKHRSRSEPSSPVRDISKATTLRSHLPNLGNFTLGAG